MLKVRTNAWRMISTHLVNYASPLIIPTKEPKAPFYTSPEVIGSVLLMWDIKFNGESMQDYNCYD